MERLQRVLAAAGIASRRRAEELIIEGRVRVDGQVVTELGTQVDPMRQKIEVDGKIIPRPTMRYILLNKPKGYITTMSDERGRDTVMDLVQVSERVVPVGRLDRQTEGLLLLTNDGLVAHRVMHPSYQIDKEYEALLDGHPPPAVLDRLRRGIVIDGERAQPEMVRPIKNVEDGTVVRIVIHEGRNRIVRRMFEEVGYPVLQLVRTRIGPLQLGDIPRGYWRELREGELRQLRDALHITDEDLAEQQRGERRGRPGGGRPEAGGAPRGPARSQAGRPQRPTGSRPGGPARGSRPVSGRPASGGRPGEGERRERRDGERPGGPRQQRWEEGRPSAPRPPRRDEDRPRGPRPERRDGEQRREPRPARRDNQPAGQRGGPPRRDDDRRRREGPPTDGRPRRPARPADDRGRDEDRRPRHGDRSAQRDTRPARRPESPRPERPQRGPRRDQDERPRRDDGGERSRPANERRGIGGPPRRTRKPPIRGRNRRTGGSG